MRLWDAAIVAHGVILDLVVVRARTLLSHEFSLVHKLTSHRFQCVVSKNLRLLQIIVVGGTFQCLFTLLNIVSETIALFLGPLVLLSVMLSGKVSRFIVIVVGWAWYFALGALGFVDDFRKVCRFWLFV